jgi:uroporphyrinogen decarboxylase
MPGGGEVGMAGPPRNDRFLRACRREAVDATPVWFMRQAGRSLPEYRAIRARATLADIVRDPALCAEVTLQPVRRHGVDAAILFADITTPLPGIGIDVRIVDGVGPVIDPPLRDREALERLRPFDASEAMGPLLEAIALLRRELDVPLIGFGGAPFTLAAYVVEGRGAREAATLKRLMHADAGLFGDLLDRLVEMSLAYAGAQVAAGVQAFQVFDSWVGALAPLDYERHVAPRMARLFEGLARLGVPTIHFGTGAAGLLEAMAGAGGDVIGLDWRVRLADAWARVPDRAVQGNLDPHVLLAPWEAVATHATHVLDEAAGRPGHVFNLGHGVLPGTPPQHLTRLVELVHERSARRVGALA